MVRDTLARSIVVLPADYSSFLWYRIGGGFQDVLPQVLENSKNSHYNEGKCVQSPSTCTSVLELTMFGIRASRIRSMRAPRLDVSRSCRRFGTLFPPTHLDSTLLFVAMDVPDEFRCCTKKEWFGSTIRGGASLYVKMFKRLNEI
jgi:hypothetical protein